MSTISNDFPCVYRWGTYATQAIFCARDSLKMRYADTGSRSAQVVYDQVLFRLFVVDQINPPVGQRAHWFATGKNAVSINIDASSPEPAAGRKVYTLVEGKKIGG